MAKSNLDLPLPGTFLENEHITTLTDAYLIDAEERGIVKKQVLPVDHKNLYYRNNKDKISNSRLP